MILTLLVLLSLCRIGSATGWIAVERDVFVPFDLESTPLEIRTDSEVGSWDLVRVWFYTARYDYAGGVDLYFYSPIQYLLSPCTDYTDLPTNPPSTRDKVWRITLTRTSGVRVVVHCNDVEVVNVLLSDTTCYWGRWYWSTGDVAVIRFSPRDTASVDYRPYTERCDAGKFLDQSSGCQNCTADHWSASENTASSCTACPTGKEVGTGLGKQESDCMWRARAAGAWHTVSRGSKITVNFKKNDFEVRVHGSHNTQMDVHFQVGSGWVALEWHLSSNSQKIRYDMHTSGVGSGCNTDGYLTSVPVPSTSSRTWIFKKDAAYLYIYCSDVQVAKIPRSDYRCLSSTTWSHLGSSSNPVFFNSDDRASKKWRLTPKRVDGGYTDFGDWSECSEFCGDGTQTRTRTCTNPAPAHGGADCVGEASDTQSCKLNDCPEFSLVDSNGDTAGTGLLGLLISNGGTVCDDFFSAESAEAICREMGYAGHKSYTSSDNWDIQSQIEIKLDDVACTSGEWSSCTFSYTHNCNHGEDVFLECEEVAPICIPKNGTELEQGKTYNPNENTQCRCDARGRHSCTCLNDDQSVQCSPPTGVAWFDEQCNKICIPQPATCKSSNDPYYKSFDGWGYYFHGRCTYQAASCDDFKIKLKNKDLDGRLPPTYTDRMILEFKSHSFAIHSAGYSVFIDDIKVQVPYYKTFTNGDRVSIENNGQLVMSLYSKGRNPSAQLTARRLRGGRWINVAIQLHGSCAGFSEGLCGVWNGDRTDDLFNNSPNANAVKYMEYDENCPPPPAPYHPCDDVGGPEKKAEAMAICKKLTEPPFSECNNVVPVGDENGGAINTCTTEVCNCMMDKSCACPEFDVYAEECIASGVDVSNWRESAEYDFCPYECPEGEVYMPDGPVPSPTCLDKNPTKRGTARGCFCPKGQFLQDEQCVHADQCKCLHEGVFYNNGDEIREEGECEVCTCEDSGEMSCDEMTCPELNCAEDELISYREDVCCPYCLSDWVEAVNPEVELNSGQSAVLTCAIHAANVNTRNINWYKDGKRLSEGISRDRLQLTIADAGSSDSGDYRCEAKMNGKAASGTFVVEVHAPIIECTAGNYMTENGCQQCAKNTFSGDGAESCTNCPDDKISVPGSTSEDDCGETVNGGWTNWGRWTECDCDYIAGTGTWNRTRSCTNPPPSSYGTDCVGELLQNGTCDNQCFRHCPELTTNDLVGEGFYHYKLSFPKDVYKRIWLTDTGSDSPTKYGSEVDIVCEDCYYLCGLDKRTCLPDRTWGEEIPLCQIRSCHRPESDETKSNAIYKPTKSVYDCGDTVIFQCKDDCYEYDEGTETHTCQPDLPDNYDPWQSKAKWYGNPYSCKIKQCRALEAPENGQISSTETTCGTTVNFSCDEWHKLLGKKELKCQSDKTWSADVPTCVRE